MFRTFSPTAGNSLRIATDRPAEYYWLKWLAVAFALLWSASFFQDVMLYGMQPFDAERKVWILDVDVERSFYTWLSTVSLFSAALLLLALGDRTERRNRVLRWGWTSLAAVFLFLSLDESKSIHEELSKIMNVALDGHSGLFYFAWVIPAMVVVAIGFVVYIPFFRALPASTRNWMFVSAGLFLSGAIGMEMLGGRTAELEGVQVLTYRIFVNIEEGLEATGILLFLRVLLSAREAGRPST